MYVMDEAFDGWYTPKTYHDYSRIFAENWQNDLTTMIAKDYSHPSVILYSIGTRCRKRPSHRVWRPPTS